MPVVQELWRATVTCSPSFSPVADALLAEDAVSVSVLAPPRQNQAQVEALFTFEPCVSSLLAKLALMAKLRGESIPSLHVGRVESLDWLKKVASDFPPLTAGRWTIFGAAHRQAAAARRYRLQIDATNAFGTGEHPTTKGCLMMLDRLLKEGTVRPAPVGPGGSLLDMGCGSGILGMAYAQVTRRPVVAVDLDPDSVAIARGNVRVNGLGRLVTVGLSRGYASLLVKHHAPYTLIMANIFARPLCEMAKDLRQNLAPGGIAILSGLLQTQANAVLSAHRQQGLVLRDRLTLGEWSVLVLQRRRRPCSTC